MNFFKNPHIEITKEELVFVTGADMKNPGKTMDIIEDNIDVLEEGLELAEPKVIYGMFPVKKVTDNRLYLTEEEYFESKLFGRFMESAEYAALAIVTIGPEVEEKAALYMKEGKLTKGFILDCVGTLILEKTGLVLYDKLKEEAGKKGYNASSPLSPGQVGWHVTDQRKIFSRLDTQKLGVKLTESSLILPKKSVSLCVGMGEKVKADKRACDFCPLRNGCPSRKLRDYQEGKKATG